MKKKLLGAFALTGLLCLTACGSKENSAKKAFYNAYNFTDVENYTTETKAYYNGELTSVTTVERDGIYAKATISYVQNPESEYLKDQIAYYVLDFDNDYLALFLYEDNEYTKESTLSTAEVKEVFNDAKQLENNLFDKLTYDKEKQTYSATGLKYSEIFDLDVSYLDNYSFDYFAQFDDGKVVSVVCEGTYTSTYSTFTSRTEETITYGTAIVVFPDELLEIIEEDRKN
ncbi:MAG: hypothetical protein K5892_05325 [Acholeplasmatales bacterium]|nr:hypothetical protein [Acholeplasmatales bacterium]